MLMMTKDYSTEYVKYVTPGSGFCCFMVQMIKIFFKTISVTPE